MAAQEAFHNFHKQLQQTTPVVDLGRLLDPQHYQEGMDKTRTALLDWGFVEFINHGITDQLFDNAFKAAQDFFALPADEEVKSVVHMEGRLPAFQPGYQGDLRSMDGIKRLKEHFLLISFRRPGVTLKPNPNAPIQNVWPEKPENFRGAVEKAHDAISVVSEQLYSVFSESLGLKPSYIRDHFFTEDTISTRPTYVHHYLQSENAAVDGVPPHQDGSVFTIVVQANRGVDGLEVWKDEEWVTISPNKYSLIVNSGDVMKVWSNGEFKSMTHRVRNNKAGSRYSMAYFVIPSRDLLVEPIQKRLVAGVELKYMPFTFSDESL